jgi:methyl-accepting chemotaxis protein
MRTLTTKCILTFAVLDLLFNPLVMAAYVQLLGFERAGPAFTIMTVACLVKIAACASFLASDLRGVEAFRRDAAGPEALRSADRALQHLPRRFGGFYATSWSLTYGLGFVAITAIHPDLALDPRAANAVLLVVIAVWFGGLAFAFPIVAMLTSDVAGDLSVKAKDAGIALDRPTTSLQLRIGLIALALGLGPTLWMMGLGYMKQLDAHTASAELSAELAAVRAADEWDEHGALTPTQAKTDADVVAFGVSRRVLALGATGTVAPADGWLSDAAVEWLNEQPQSARAGVLADARLQRVFAFQRIDETRRAIVKLDTGANSPSGFILSAAIFALVVGLWAPLCAIALARSVSAPLQRLTNSAREIVEEGKQSEMGALPVPRADEVGVLSGRFNDLIDMMRDLSRAADAIASGDLRVTIERQGELPDAFRRMLESLRGMVSEIRQTSVSLGSAATEIFAATQEQEAAATSQSSAMEEISRTMDSLSESAAHVSDSVAGVLSNAERTLENTDDMVGRIGQLSTHAGRISEILEVIREIANRSDILALNGSLEASRAGEGGQGFALVASEMRRLTERVTASVEDIKKLVADIRDSSSTTVMATEESKRLAEETTEAARQITFVTQQQRSGTEQVSQSVKNIADVVTQAVSATSQTRTSAEGLKSQADRLAELVRKFEVAKVGAE